MDNTGEGGGGGELDPRLRPKGPEGHTLRDGLGPKMWVEARVPKE